MLTCIGGSVNARVFDCVCVRASVVAAGAVLRPQFCGNTLQLNHLGKKMYPVLVYRVNIGQENLNFCKIHH